VSAPPIARHRRLPEHACNLPPAVILVSDGEQRSALAVTRSLGRAAHTVHVTSATGRSLAGASRFARAEHRLPDPLLDPAGFAVELANLSRRVGAQIVVPVTDASHQALMEWPRAGEAPILPVPEAEAYYSLSDKRRARELARSVGIAVPEQWVVEAPGEALPQDIVYPVFAKPSRSVVVRGDRLVKTAVRSAPDASSLEAALGGFPEAAYPVLVQRRVTGVGEGQFLLRWDGEVRAAFAHRRLREKPPRGGQSVYRESVPLEPELLDRSIRLLEAVDWQGVAMVEYKRDTETGTPYLMEVNGRFWGSLQLAIDAGVDFPRLLVDSALGAGGSGGTAVDRNSPGYRAGVRSRWLWGDIDHLIARRRTDRSELPPGQPVGLRFVLDFLRPPVGRDRLEVLRLSDPRPFLRESALWLGSSRRQKTRIKR
jgi:predicted ATP-grasp superfamily ATP-dependent carboligase